MDDTNIDTPEKGIVLYHHFDGYPAGVGAFLKEKVEGMGKCYNAYALATYLIRSKEMNSSEFYTGFELTRGVHSDIDYLYTVHLHNNACKKYDNGEYKFDVELECRAVPEYDMTITRIMQEPVIPLEFDEMGRLISKEKQE